MKIKHSLFRLTLLEEIVVNDNLLTELPSCIGFLRQLQTLIADGNRIEQLPKSICSCTNLRILSIGNNFIKCLPEELGRLTSLQVLNVRNNNLSYLPFSLTKISNLKSLWLSENQNKPLVQFHSEVIHNPYQKVLTCVLLPQITQEHILTGADIPAVTQTRRKSSFLISSIDKPLINFNINLDESSMEENQDHGRLLRQPTPYPKDLKVHARHARNLVLKHLDLGNISIDNVEKTDEITTSKTY